MKIDLLYKGIIGILKDMKKLISIILTALLLGTALFAEIPDEEITTMNFNPDQISKLDINFAAGNVKVQAVKTNEITVTVTREYDAPAATTKIEKGTLSIKTKLFSNYKKKIDVLVDIPFGKEFEEIKTTCVSANSTNKNMTEIALEVGFSTPNYFNSVFKKVNGNSPTYYRRLKFGNMWADYGEISAN